jgi:hypothetical protein
LRGSRVGGERSLFRQLCIDYPAIGETKMKKCLGDEAKVSVENEISTLALHGEGMAAKSLGLRFGPASSTLIFIVTTLKARLMASTVGRF